MFSATESACSSLLQALTQGQADSIRKLKQMQMIKDMHVSSKRYPCIHTSDDSLLSHLSSIKIDINPWPRLYL